MREALSFIASLASAVVLTALAVLIAPVSLIWQWFLYGGSIVLFLCAAVLMVDIIRRRWRSNSQIDRIPITTLIKMATKLGWNFVSDNSLHLLDMQDAIRQGGSDGTLTIWGKLDKWTSDNLMRTEVLEMIPPEHWREFFVYLFPTQDDDNFHVKSWSPNKELKGYIDLHVDRTQAFAWLKRDAATFKGKTKPR